MQSAAALRPVEQSSLQPPCGRWTMQSAAALRPVEQSSLQPPCAGGQCSLQPPCGWWNKAVYSRPAATGDSPHLQVWGGISEKIRVRFSGRQKFRNRFFRGCCNTYGSLLRWDKISTRGGASAGLGPLQSLDLRELSFSRRCRRTRGNRAPNGAGVPLAQDAAQRSPG